jgi:hypothetical protein
MSVTFAASVQADVEERGILDRPQIVGNVAVVAPVAGSLNNNEEDPGE